MTKIHDTTSTKSEDLLLMFYDNETGRLIHDNVSKFSVIPAKDSLVQFNHSDIYKVVNCGKYNYIEKRLVVDILIKKVEK